MLKSRAVPKGLPEKPGEQRLAIAGEDHPLDYIGFQGTIPEGVYGAGEVKIRDTGSYELLIWTDDRIEVFLHGQASSGNYVLIRFKKSGREGVAGAQGKGHRGICNCSAQHASLRDQMRLHDAVNGIHTGVATAKIFSPFFPLMNAAHDSYRCP